jgi:PAS domain S-box-containing protein
MVTSLWNRVSFGHESMAQSEPIAILIVNEHAEEIKLVTTSLRSFFSDARIDVAYSADEAERMTRARSGPWTVVLIDDASLPDPPSPFIAELKRRASYASVILQSSRMDSAAALEALKMGADLFLYKHSPAFLTELLFCTREAFDKRESKSASARADMRHAWLVESMDDVLYELDADGRFVTLSRHLPASLGYRPEDLIGRPYSTLISDTEQPLARFRFNERRAGDRAVREFELTLQGKETAEGMVRRMRASISACGLYDQSQRFIGTIGLLRTLSDGRNEPSIQQELSRQRQRAEELHTVIRQMTELSRSLEQPLSSLLHESQQLLSSLRESRVLDRLQALTGHAAASAELVQRLTRLAPQAAAPHVVHCLLSEILGPASPSGVTVEFAPALPDYGGDREATARLFRQLLAYAGAYLTTVERPHMLALTTSAGGLAHPPETPSLSPLASTTHIQLDIVETSQINPSGRVSSSLTGALDVLNLYRLAEELGAMLDISAPPSGPFRLTVRLPTRAAPSSAPPREKQDDASAVGRPFEAPAALPAPAALDAGAAATTERRGTPRVEIALPATITRGSSSWQGTVVNLSVGGARIRMADDFPPMASQDAIIWVTTAIATLELRGIVRTRTVRELQLIVQFVAATQTETAVLASLIAAARERSLSFSLDVRLPAAAPDEGRGTPRAFDLAEYDRRETVRVPTALTARLETASRQEPATRLPARVLNLSRSGACLVAGEHPEAVEGSVRIHFAPADRHDPGGSHEPGAPDAILAARVVWRAADPTAPSTLHAPHLDRAARTGLRFEALTPYAERELNRVIRQHLRAQRSGEAISVPAPVVSVPRECRNARGQAIAITDDHASQLTDPNRPLIIVAPGYGQTAADYTALAYYLAEHHFRVLRYDPTNHLGNSEGELQQTTLRSMQHDLEKIIEFVRQTWPQAPVVVIASDLAARGALRTAAHNSPLDLLLLINPAIDVGALLKTVHGHDLIADYQFGLRRGVCNLLGLNVNVDLFVGDLIAGRCADLESTLEDLRLVRSPLCIATSRADSTALPPTDLPHLFMTALGARTRLVNISSPVTDRHLDVHGAPPAAFRQLLTQIGSVLSVQPIPPKQEIAAQPYVARQHRIEQEYTVLRHDGSQINREALCAAHLSQLPHLGNLHEYRKLLDDLYGLMSPLEPGAVLVDAGIGQSDLTRAALVNHTYRAGQASWTGRPAPLMVGVGRSRERIGRARHSVLVLQRELATGFAGRLSAMPPLTIGWIQADWMSALPFKNGAVSRMICNLSLPYVPSPLAALKEWHRVLHPEGTLIFTTFHPNTDLSAIYRRHLRQANQDEFSAQAQPVLHYFARLREGIRHGILHAFDEAHLAGLLGQCGIASFRILPIMDGQALVAIVGKQNSSSSNR